MIFCAILEICLGIILLAAVFIFKIDEKYAQAFFDAYPKGYLEEKTIIYSRLIKWFHLPYTEQSVGIGAQFQFILVAVINIAIGILAIIMKDEILTPSFRLSP